MIWLMEKLGLPYELKSYPRQPNYMAAPAFLALHPVGHAPVIEDGDVQLAESLAIVTYILELYGKDALRVAPGETGYADYVYWMAYSIGGPAPDGIIILQFPSMADAKAWYGSPAYQAAVPYRQKAADYNVVFVEGI
jgi:glutathione S-transferase